MPLCKRSTGAMVFASKTLAFSLSTPFRSRCRRSIDLLRSTYFTFGMERQANSHIRKQICSETGPGHHRSGIPDMDVWGVLSNHHETCRIDRVVEWRVQGAPHNRRLSVGHCSASGPIVTQVNPRHVRTPSLPEAMASAQRKVSRLFSRPNSNGVRHACREAWLPSDFDPVGSLFLSGKRAAVFCRLLNQLCHL